MESMGNESRLDELNNFIHELWEFSDAIRRYAESEKLTEKQKKRAAELYVVLSKKVGYLGTLISELSGISKVNLQGKDYDMWFIALKMPADKHSNNALGVCIQATNRAIGKLADDIRTGKRDKFSGEVITIPSSIDLDTIEKPKAFIAHGGRSGVLDKLREFIEALGIKTIIVELSASKGMTVDDKVNKYIKDADCGIVLATKGGIIDTKSKEPKQHPRLNVIDELERLRSAFPERTILLLERGVNLPSNISGLTHEPFVGQSMDRAFTAIARELTEFGILKAIKPQE